MIKDNDIREPLFEFLETEYGKVRILEEKNMGRSRADVIMITDGAITGIEIKSDADSYARLARQVQDYDKYYDYNIIVVGSSHAQHVREHVPEYWGVISVEELADSTETVSQQALKLDFYTIRQPQLNPHQELSCKLRLLWRPELALLQEKHDMPKYKNRSKEFVIEQIAGRVPDIINREILDRQISELLFERDYTTILETINTYRVQEGRRKRTKRAFRKRKR